VRQVEGEGELHFRVELLDHPASALPSLAACGSEDSVVPPKNANAAVSFLVRTFTTTGHSAQTSGTQKTTLFPVPQVQETREGKVVTRAPAPPPEPHNGYDFKEVAKFSNVLDHCG